MKGQGISINVIIIAAIALLVLVILSVLLLRSVDQTARGTSCEGAVGGSCQASDQCSGFLDRTKSCPEARPFCCIPTPQ